MMNEAHFNCCIVFVACFGALFLLFKILKFCRINCEGYYENPPLSQSRFHSEENTCWPDFMYRVSPSLKTARRQMFSVKPNPGQNCHFCKTHIFLSLRWISSWPGFSVSLFGPFPMLQCSRLQSTVTSEGFQCSGNHRRLVINRIKVERKKESWINHHSF